MNFLAHLYLSPDDEEIMIGNFIADAVKGKQINKFSDEVKRGIVLHRHIDAYTDEHPVFRKSADRLKLKYRMYSKVIVDIYYDHYLARNWDHYADSELVGFSSFVYKRIVKYYNMLPPRYKRILPFMIAQNWLAGYASFWSLEKVFKGMARRTGYKSGMEYAVADLKKNYSEFRDEFELFFPDIIDYVAELDY